MIFELFETLPKIEGMEAVIIYNKSNKIIDSWTLPSFSTQILEELGFNYHQVFEMLDLFPNPHDEIVLDFEKQQIYARFNEGFLILTVSKKLAAIPLIRLAITVGFEKNSVSKKSKKRFSLFGGKKTVYLKSNSIDSVEAKYLEKMKNGYSEKGITDWEQN